jgi:hypothetical protein
MCLRLEQRVIPISLHPPSPISPSLISPSLIPACRFLVIRLLLLEPVKQCSRGLNYLGIELILPFSAQASIGYYEAGRDASHHWDAAHLQDWIRRHRRRHRAQTRRDGGPKGRQGSYCFSF